MKIHTPQKLYLRWMPLLALLVTIILLQHLSLRMVALPATATALVLKAPVVATEPSAAANLFDQLGLKSLGLNRQVYEYATRGFQNMKAMGQLRNDQVLSIVDFSKPSSQKRLYIIDVVQGKLLFHTYVAHGMKSGKQFATRFSNILESNQSSLGFYQTLGAYMGENGYSLRLNGVEKGFNDNANKRAIVMHGAPYVNEKLIYTQGYLGRSWGCPAVPSRLSKPIINKIKNGTCLFIYSPDENYLVRSRVLNANPAPVKGTSFGRLG